MGLVGQTGSSSDSGVLKGAEPGKHPKGDAKPSAGGPDRPVISNSSTGSFRPAALEKEATVISNRPAASAREFYAQMPLAELADALEGRVLDHFQVTQLIGGGGMGAVFRGQDQRLDRSVAIKVIPGSKRSAEMLRRFRLEAQAAARLDHPNIARVFYVGQSDEWDYIVFEYIDGINVRDLVESEGPLTVDDAVFFTRQIAEALQHSHERDVVHRDIKPSNILVTATGIAKLVDMGLARDTSLDQSSADRTASGVTLGTFDYISPEQARNPRDADVRSDLYSLGCSLFFMLTGNPPFPGGTALQKLLNHGSQPAPDPRGWREDLPDELCQILLKLLAKRPADRYQKPAELVNDLVMLAKLDDLPRSQGPTTLAIDPSIARPTWLETHLPWIVGAMLLLGSTLWLKSQSLSSGGFTLPAINLPTTKATDQSRLSPTTGNQDESRDNFTSMDPINVRSASRSSVGDGSTLPATTPTASKNLSTQESLSSRGTPTSSAPMNDSHNAELTLPAGSKTTATIDSELPSATNSLASNSTTSPTPAAILTPDVASINPPTAGTVPDIFDTESSAPVLVVATVAPSDVDARNWESSLYRAVERVLSQPSSGVTIEIRGSVWLDRPLGIGGPSTTAIRSQGSKQLVIRGGAGSNAKIEVARSVWNNLKAEAGIIRVVDASLILQGIELQSTFREAEKRPRNIIQLEGSAALTARQCTFTLKGPDPDSFHLMAIGPESMVRDALAGSLATTASVGGVRIGLEGCFVRGGASIIKIEQTQVSDKRSVQLSFKDCVVAVEGRVLDLASGTGQGGVERIVRVFCDASTFVSASGFAKLDFVGTARPLIGLSRTSHACVFWSRPRTPHITISSALDDLHDNPDVLLLQGMNNAYDQNLEILCQTRGQDDATIELSSTQGQQDGWSVERGTDRVVAWKKPAVQSLALENATLGDFELASNHFVPGFRAGKQTESLDP